MPEWLVEHGIGESRAALVDKGVIIEARIQLEGAIPAGTVIEARLVDLGTDGRNGIALSSDGTEYLLPYVGRGLNEGQRLALEVTRPPIPGPEPWKRPMAKPTSREPCPPGALAQQLQKAGEQVRELTFPAATDELGEAGWNDVLEEAKSGLVHFREGSLGVFVTPAMTLIDVDGRLPPGELMVRGAEEAARSIRRLDIGGSIGIDLPTGGSKAARQQAAGAIDAVLPQPFERTAVNGFGFIQLVRPRSRVSLVELALDRTAFEARALLRRAAFEPAGAKRLVANPAVIGTLAREEDWVETLARQVGGAVSLRADAALPMSGGYAENA